MRRQLADPVQTIGKKTAQTRPYQDEPLFGLRKDEVFDQRYRRQRRDRQSRRKDTRRAKVLAKGLVFGVLAVTSKTVQMDDHISRKKEKSGVANKVGHFWHIKCGVFVGNVCIWIVMKREND